MDTITIETEVKYSKADDYGLCPECGGVMNEVDRIKEGQYIYIWLECSKSDCMGQWLKKVSCFGGI